MEGVRPADESESRADLKGSVDGLRGMVPGRPAGRSAEPAFLLTGREGVPLRRGTRVCECVVSITGGSPLFVCGVFRLRRGRVGPSSVCKRGGPDPETTLNWLPAPLHLRPFRRFSAFGYGRQFPVSLGGDP